MGKDIRVIQVTFNVLDPDQRRAFEYAKGKTNSSGYIKRLIDRDLGLRPSAVDDTAPHVSVLPAEDLEFEATGFI